MISNNRITKHDEEGCNFNTQLPPIPALLAALVGLIVGFWGLWNLGMGNGRIVISTFGAISGTILWVYGVNWILVWSLGIVC